MLENKHTDTDIERICADLLEELDTFDEAGQSGHWLAAIVVLKLRKLRQTRANTQEIG